MVTTAKVLSASTDEKHVNVRKLQAQALPISCKGSAGKWEWQEAAQTNRPSKCRIKIQLTVHTHLVPFLALTRFLVSALAVASKAW